MAKQEAELVGKEPAELPSRITLLGLGLLTEHGAH
jgi:hypothetical protein